MVADKGEGRREVAFPEEPEHGALGGVDAVGGEDDGAAAVEDNGMAGDGSDMDPRIEAAATGGGFAAVGGATDGQKLGEAELGFDVVGEGVEIAVVAEEAVEAVPGGLVGYGEVGRQGTVGSGAGKEPFEGKARVEGEELAEAVGEAAVALEGGVVDGDAVVGKVLLHASLAGGDLPPAVGHRVVTEGIVEGGGEVGESGAEAQADEEGAGREAPVVGQFAGIGGAAEGGRVGALFAEALAASEFAEEEASGLGGEEAGEGDRGDGEGGGDGDARVVGEVRDEVAGGHGGEGGLFEDRTEDGHGRESGGERGGKSRNFRKCKSGEGAGDGMEAGDGGAERGWERGWDCQEGGREDIVEKI